MPTRLVSFLGLGDNRPEAKPPYYSPTFYELDGKRSSETPLMERALCDLLEIDSIVVLGTKEVKTRWFDTGLFGGLFGHKPHGGLNGKGFH